MPDRNVKSSLRRSRSPVGILVVLCLLVPPAAWAQVPAPDPPPSGIAPDPPPDAVAPPPPPPPRVVAAPPIVDVVAPPPAQAPREESAEPPARPAKELQPQPKAKAAPEPPVPVDSQPRDSLMPRVELGPPAKVLERSRLVLAGLALVVVALGGAVVLGAGRRALVEAGT